MPSKGSITKTIRIDAENTALIEEMVAQGKSYSGAVNELIRGTPLEVRGTPLEERGTPRTMYEEELESMANKLGTDEFTLLEVMNYLIDNKKLCRIDGKLKLIGMNADPSYISVDEAIDGLKAPEWKKNKYKQDILNNLNLDRNDDTGNGGGL